MARESGGHLIAILTVALSAAFYVLVFDPSGQFLSQARQLRDKASYDLMLGGNRLWVLSTDSKSPVVVFSNDGEKARSLAFAKRWWTRSGPAATPPQANRDSDTAHRGPISQPSQSVPHD